MYETNTVPIQKSAEKMFLFMLSFYPEEYRKHFGQEMLFVFEDLCQEELEKNNRLTVGFWIREIADVTQSILQEHIHELNKKGMKKYLQQTFHINSYNLVSIVLLLPILLMTGIDIVSRFVQGDLVHYNRPVYTFFSHTFLYWRPVLFTWVILFPLLAVIISVIPLVKSLQEKKVSLLSWAFVRKSIFGVAILLFGLGFIALIRLHDFVPCMFYGLTHFGFANLNHILSVCKKA